MFDRELEQVTERAKGLCCAAAAMDLDGWMAAQGARPIADFNGGEKKPKVKGKAVKKRHLATWPQQPPFVKLTQQRITG